MSRRHHSTNNCPSSVVNGIRRRLQRTGDAVGYGLFVTVLIFLIVLTGLLNHPTEGDGDGETRHERAVRSGRGPTAANVLPEPNHDEEDSRGERVGPGELGEPVNISRESLGPEEEKEKFQELFDRNSFNEYASDLISVRRRLSDMRSNNCKADAKQYLPNLPDTSVIVCFHNEAWSTLIRSMHSILDRTPPHLLTEIIFVDDGSTQEHLQERLESYIKRYPKVKLIRAGKRIGLIKGRLLGYKHATGTVLTFLDSHIECTPGWAEPLLDRIARNWSNVVWPVIDVISWKTLEFKNDGEASYGRQVGGFDWGLQFNWHPIPKRDDTARPHSTAPVRSPTMAGGLFSIDRKYFEHLGTYDEEFDIWGGENLELSFKTWMCGGTLEMVPCSRVGHIFREKSPYKWREGQDVLKRNLVRLAAVWMDEYAQYYFDRISNNTGDYGDISSRIALREKLQCKSFQWYLENIFPEMFIPDKARAFGEVKNAAHDGKYCMDAINEKGNKSVDIYPCHGQGGNQYFSYSNGSEIRRDDVCLDYAKTKIVLVNCHGGRGNQEWIHDRESQAIRNPGSNKCLSLDIERMTIEPLPCDADQPEQQWTFSNYDETNYHWPKLTHDPRDENPQERSL